jgi:hypothetical protein
MASNEFKILTEFKNSLITFIDELISQFPEEGDFVIIRIFLKDQVPIVDVINHVIRDILPIKMLVTAKDENFFLENNVLFGSLNKNKVNHFKKLWRSGRLDTDDKNVVWKWMESFIFLAEKYQKIKTIQ